MNKVQMAAKLYDTRDTMKRFWKDEYAGKVAEYRPYIEAAMKKYNCDVIPAMIKICENLQRECPDCGGMSQALIIAAAVEMVEGVNDKGNMRGNMLTFKNTTRLCRVMLTRLFGGIDYFQREVRLEG